MSITLQPEHEQLIKILIQSGQYADANEVISAAIQALVEQNRLALECAKLDSAEEQALAEEGMTFELDLWSQY